MKDWAEDKVTLLVPNIPEKKTLFAIAHFANANGQNAWPAIATIAKRSCQSERTVQRHIKKLIELGYLVQEIAGGKGPKDTAQYWIPICKMSDGQWEEYKQMSKRQMKLNFPEKKGDMVSPKGDMVSPFKGDMVSPNPPLLTNLKNRLGDTEILKDFPSEKTLTPSGDFKMKSSPQKASNEVHENFGPTAISEETEHMIREVTEKLRKAAVEIGPSKLGTRLRESIYGTREKAGVVEVGVVEDRGS